MGCITTSMYLKAKKIMITMLVIRPLAFSGKNKDVALKQ